MVDSEFLFPPKTTLSFYDGWDRTLFTTKDRSIDLADSLMLSHPYNSRKIYIGVRTDAKSWHEWDEERLRKIESLIRYDLEFDGYRISLKRLHLPGADCIYEFRWSIQIRSL